VAGKAGEDEFRQAVAELEAGMAAHCQSRPELTFEEEPAPRRLAPFAYAVAATVAGSAVGGVVGSAARQGQDEASDAEIGWGRFVLLFDAAGQEGWDGKYRIISYVRAELEPEMAADPLINAVGWSWLTEALDLRTTGYRKISGTVTTVMTQGFGGKQDEPNSTGFELRASWSPLLASTGSADLDGHLAAWSDTVCTAAGLPPLAPGVAPLRPQRRRPRP
jgi:hypothetical protein